MPGRPAYVFTETLFKDSRTYRYRAIRQVDQLPVVIETLDSHGCRPVDVERLRRAYEIGTSIHLAAVARPLALETHEGVPVLVLEDGGGQPLDRVVAVLETRDKVLELAARIAAAVSDLHGQGVVHKDLKPENILVHPITLEVKLVGLGLATRLARGQQAGRPPQLIEGSLPYMSPEQTGRLHRTIDSRTDLYSLGVTFYRMLTGRLPFEAGDPLEWVHSHVARAPAPPTQLVPELPEVVGRIVMKLLEKMAEDRYQTASGLQHDLAHCLEQWRERGRIDPFELGAFDLPDRLWLSQRLYGRRPQRAALLAAFERVTSTGTPEMVLVSGYSGIGKTSLVRELQAPVLERKGLFIEGKFDQYKPDVPYLPIVQAFGELVLNISALDEAQIAEWRQELRAALGTSAQLLVDVIPQLELLIGRQPPVAPLPPAEAQNRFRYLFRRFVGVFTRDERPLTLFIDDLQWADPASLALLQDLVSHPETRLLLLVGAYRDNEVAPSHPLLLALEQTKRARARVSELVVGPLSSEDLAALVAEALHCSARDAAPLASLVLDKTGGNPFFVVQFLTTLHHEALIDLDPSTGRWRWDAAKIKAAAFTDNVVELMVTRLRDLPVETQHTLELAACLGVTVNMELLAAACENGPPRGSLVMKSVLRPALDDDLLFWLERAYRFSHDRVREAAYSLIPEDARAAVHLSIGRRLLAGLSEAAIAEHLFDVVNQLNRGIGLITSQAERDLVRRWNVVAGRRAKASTAHDSARTYLALAAELLPANAWQVEYEDTFALELDLAECEYLVGNFAAAEGLSGRILSNLRSDIDRAAVYRLRIRMNEVAGRNGEAMVAVREALGLFGIGVPQSDEELSTAIEIENREITVNLGNRSIAQLADAPAATDPVIRAITSVIADGLSPAYMAQQRHFPFLVAKGVNVCLRRGNTAESSSIYNSYALVLAGAGELQSAFDFSEMALRLLARVDTPRERGVLLFRHGFFVNHWRNHIATSLAYLEEGAAASLAAGNFLYAGYARFGLVETSIEKGDPLDEILQATESFEELAARAHNDASRDTLRVQRQFAACLKGLTRGTVSFDGADFSEAEGVAGFALWRYHVFKQTVSYLYGRYDEAFAWAERASEALEGVVALLLVATHHFYRALTIAALYQEASGARRDELKRWLDEEVLLHRRWAEYCPSNFENRCALLSAEVARIEGRDRDAMSLYEQAIRSARANGFVQNEAIGHELASSFYRERGLELIADVYLRNARDSYVRWGADAKVREIETRHPAVVPRQPLDHMDASALRPEQLDLLAVIKASQAISGALVREQLLELLLAVVLEHGGARRARLVLIRDGADGGELEVAAEKTVDDAAALLEGGAAVPQSLLEYVRRTGLLVVLDDTRNDAGRFAGDPYFSRARPCSVLCLPVRRQGTIIGLLYLENDLTRGVFTPERLLTLELLAAQAAVSLENAHLLSRERAGREQAEADRRRAVLLGEVTAMMSAAPSRQGMVDALRHVCSRELAEWAVLDSVEGGTSKHLVWSHRDPLRELLIRRLTELHPTRIGLGLNLPALVDGGAPLHLASLSDEQLRERCVDDRQLELVRELDARSILVIPLVARGVRVGVLSVGRGSARPFQPADVDLVSELGRRAAMALDNDRLSELEGRLRQSQKMEAIGRLAGGVAHDFNNLLCVILGCTDILMSDLRAEDNVSTQLEEIQRAAERAAELTRQLLAFSRQQVLRAVVLDLNLVVTGMESLLVRLLGRNVELVTLPSPSPMMVRADGGQLGQVLMNLAVNARDAMPDGGSLTIETYAVELGEDYAQTHPSVQPGSYVVLSVTDAGIGIDRETQTHIFEPFFTTKEPGKGTGLGLATVLGIVQQSGGHIVVDGEPGRGTKFAVYLPRCDAKPAVEPAPVGDSIASSGTETVLLVEDDEHVRLTVRRILQRSGYSVLEAPGPGDGLLICQQHEGPIQLLLSDIQMPRMTGIELARQVRSTRPGIRVLLMSGYADASVIRAALDSTDAVFLQKPFTPDALRKAVRDLLDRKESTSAGSSALARD